jgi:hypothetical protein
MDLQKILGDLFLRQHLPKDRIMRCGGESFHDLSVIVVML